MGFALKKFIAAFLMPIPLSLLALGAAIYFLYVKRYKLAKFFLLGASLIIVLSSNDYFANAYAGVLENRYKTTQPIETKVDYIFVLGSGHDDSAFLPLSSMPSDSAMKRLVHGVMLYKKYTGAKLIVSGYGGTTDISHAEVAAMFVESLGVKKEDLILFQNTHDTFEEAKVFKSLYGEGNFILVTSAMHSVRADAIFRKLSLFPTLSPTDFATSDRTKIFRFSANNIKTVEAATHEYLGLLWYKIRGYI
jgi:uncharacterized SAM-binding protein YcdF (DUF218 family)